MINVFRGETAFGSGDTSLTVNIGGTVDTSKAFIIVTEKGFNGDTERSRYSAVFNSATQITLTRGESGTAGNVTWQVIEATQGEFEIIDSGSVAIGSGDTTINETVNNVGDTGQCTVFISGNFASSDDNTQQLFTAELTSTTNLQFVRQNSGSTGNLVFWIVKWHASVNVYNGTITMTGASSANSSIGGTVNLSRAALFLTFNASTNGLAQSSVLGYLDTTTAYATRESSSGNSTVKFSVVEFPADVVVQSNNESGTFNLGSAVTSDTATISAVTPANTMIVHSNMCTGTGTAYNRDKVSNFLTNSTTITFECDYTGQTRDICYYAIDFSAWSLGTSVNDQRSAKITGQDTSNSQRSSKITGQSSLRVDLVDITFSGSVNTNSERDAKITGQQSDNDERNSKLTGQATANSTRSAKITGKATSNSQRSAKTVGQDTSNSERDAKITGTATDNNERDAKLTGQATATSQRSAKIHGTDTESSERNAVITGLGGSNSNRSAKIHGTDTTSSERGAKITGQIIDERSAKVTGQDSATSERSAKTTGKDTASSERDSKLTGQDTASSERDSKITGTDTDSSERDAHLIGVQGANSNRSSKITGTETDNSERNAKTTGTQTSNSQRSGKTTGTDTANAERGAKIIGGVNSERNVKIYAGYEFSVNDSFDTTDNKDSGNTTAKWEGDGEITLN